MAFEHCVLSHSHDYSSVQNTFALKITTSFQLIWIEIWVGDPWISGEEYFSFVRNHQAIFQTASTILYFHQWAMNISSSSWC